MTNRTSDKTFEDLRQEILAEREDVRVVWDASKLKRALAMALTGMRRRMKLSQTELAKRAGWDKGYVSRLEGAAGGTPDIETLARYAKACGCELRLGFFKTSTEKEIVDLITYETVVTLQAPHDAMEPAEAAKADEQVADDIAAQA